MKLSDRMACIAANLEDLQAGIEAVLRAAAVLQADTARFDGLLNGRFRRGVVGHVRALQACACDQRVALQELRDGIARLEQELKRSNGSVRPPPGAQAIQERKKDQIAGQSRRVRSW